MWILTRLVLAFVVAVCVFGAMNRPYVSAEGLRRVPTFHPPLNKGVMVGGGVALILLLLLWKDPLGPE